MKVLTLDVRPDLRAGRSPFQRIMGAAEALKPGECLRLLAPFEPIPLYTVLGARGFGHQAQPLGEGDWEVLFSRVSDAAEDLPAPPSVGSAPAATTDREIDTRGLEPPQPMVAILEALAGLPADAGLRAWTDRRPMHLYAQLEARGFIGETEPQPDGSFLTHIRRRS